jgi:hypothetical protein
MLRLLLVDADIGLALVFGSKVPVVVVTKVEELERPEAGKVDGLERADWADDRDENIEEVEEAGRRVVDVDVSVAILWPCWLTVVFEMLKYALWAVIVVLFTLNTIKLKTLLNVRSNFAPPSLPSVVIFQV